MQVVRRRFGESVCQEVLGEVMRNSFVDALEQEKLNPLAILVSSPSKWRLAKILNL